MYINIEAILDVIMERNDVMVLKVNKKIREIKQLNRIIVIPEDFARNQLNYIVSTELLHHVISNQSAPEITYGELASKISADFNPRNLNAYLGNISDVCKENGLPLISSIVVNKNTGLPGEGFYNYFYNEQPMTEWENIFNKCKSEVINCDLWQRLLDAIES